MAGGAVRSKKPTASGSARRSKAAPRRPVGFWAVFNEWWRGEHHRLGRRPVTNEIAKWYSENANATWDTEDRPSWKDTRIHAKCLRSTEDVKMYFRRYRKSKQDGHEAAMRRDSVDGSDDDDEEDGPEDDGEEEDEDPDLTSLIAKHNRRVAAAGSMGSLPPPLLSPAARLTSFGSPAHGVTASAGQHFEAWNATGDADIDLDETSQAQTARYSLAAVAALVSPLSQQASPQQGTRPSKLLPPLTGVGAIVSPFARMAAGFVLSPQHHCHTALPKLALPAGRGADTAPEATVAHEAHAAAYLTVIERAGSSKPGQFKATAEVAPSPPLPRISCNAKTSSDMAQHTSNSNESNAAFLPVCDLDLLHPNDQWDAEPFSPASLSELNQLLFTDVDGGLVLPQFKEHRSPRQPLLSRMSQPPASPAAGAWDGLDATLPTLDGARRVQSAGRTWDHRGATAGATDDMQLQRTPSSLVYQGLAAPLFAAGTGTSNGRPPVARRSDPGPCPDDESHACNTSCPQHVQRHQSHYLNHQQPAHLAHDTNDTCPPAAPLSYYPLPACESAPFAEAAAYMQQRCAEYALDGLAVGCGLLTQPLLPPPHQRTSDSGLCSAINIGRPLQPLTGAISLNISSLERPFKRLACESLPQPLPRLEDGNGSMDHSATSPRREARRRRSCSSAMLAPMLPLLRCKELPRAQAIAQYPLPPRSSSGRRNTWEPNQTSSPWESSDSGHPQLAVERSAHSAAALQCNGLESFTNSSGAGIAGTSAFSGFTGGPFGLSGGVNDGGKGLPTCAGVASDNFGGFSCVSSACGGGTFMSDTFGLTSSGRVRRSSMFS